VTFLSTRSLKELVSCIEVSVLVWIITQRVFIDVHTIDPNEHIAHANRLVSSIVYDETKYQVLSV
jgi:hypothetical protein